MAIYGAWGEDIDFPTQGAGFACINSNSANFRSGYARGYIIHNTSSSTGKSRSTPISSPLTDLWATCRVRSNSVSVASARFWGVGYSGTANGALVVGASASSGSKIALWLQDAAGTYTELASESGNSFSGLQKWDMHIESFGASGRVRVYKDGGNSPLIDYTGAINWTGATGIDQMLPYANGGGAFCAQSEMFIADEDTRPLSLVTLSPNAAGDSNTMDTGDYTSIDELAINDADILSSSTDAQVFQCNLTNLPAGDFAVKAVKLAYRGIRGSTGITKWKAGVKSGGTIDVSQTDTMTTAWATYERLMNLNPVTTGSFTPTEIDALQLSFESET